MTNDRVEQMTASSNDMVASSELKQLYEAAFADHRSRALWNMRPRDTPTIAEVLIVARALRIEGNLASRLLAEHMEKLARASD